MPPPRSLSASHSHPCLSPHCSVESSNRARSSSRRLLSTASTVASSVEERAMCSRAHILGLHLVVLHEFDKVIQTNT